MGKSAEVEQWLSKYENPMKPVVLRIREIVLGADPRIGECVKWQAPTFTYEGNLASFFPKSKAHASLMFHVGAKIPGSHPLLTGTGDTSRVIKLGSVAEANAARKSLEKIVKAWCEWKDAGATAKPTKAAKPGRSAKPAKPAKPTKRRAAVRRAKPAASRP